MFISYGYFHSLCVEEIIKQYKMKHVHPYHLHIHYTYGWQINPIFINPHSVILFFKEGKLFAEKGSQPWVHAHIYVQKSKLVYTRREERFT